MAEKVAGVATPVTCGSSPSRLLDVEALDDHIDAEDDGLFEDRS